MIPTTSTAAIATVHSTNGSTSSPGNVRSADVPNRLPIGQSNLLDMVMASETPDGFKERFLEMHKATINKILNQF